jgi:hypothetical protein
VAVAVVPPDGAVVNVRVGGTVVYEPPLTILTVLVMVGPLPMTAVAVAWLGAVAPPRITPPTVTVGTEV